MTIGELSQMTGISPSALRYYEKKELIRVGRDAAGRRIYDEGDVEWVKFIQRLKDTGMQLKEIRRYSALRYQGDGTMARRLEILESHRLYVLDEQKKWDEYLDNLDKKIDYYKEHIK